VYVLNNNTSYNNAWTSVSLNFDPLVSFLYPGETMYVRLYAYNTNNRFMIKHNFDQQIGLLLQVVFLSTIQNLAKKQLLGRPQDGAEYQIIKKQSYKLIIVLL
jgi:hypothetical protein